MRETRDAKKYEWEHEAREKKNCERAKRATRGYEMDSLTSTDKDREERLQRKEI